MIRYALLLATLLLSACSPSKPDQAALDAVYKEEAKGQQLCAKAESEPDPWVAYQTLMNSETNCNGKRVDYLAKAVNLDNIQAFDRLYVAGSDSDIAEIDPGLSKFNNLINNGEVFDKETYARAGQLYQDGKIVMRDTKRAAEMYDLAWLNHHKYAAKYAFNLFEHNGDYKNAYLWAVRCFGECDLQRGLDGVAKEYTGNGYLSSADIKFIERLAKDKSVVFYHSELKYSGEHDAE